MMNNRSWNGGPFAQAYAHIRAALMAGHYVSGSRLKVHDIAQLLCLSPTPIREALAMLAGEAIVLRHRDGGYFVPRQDADEIADLYAFEIRCLARRPSSSRHGVHDRPYRIAGVSGDNVCDARSAIEWLIATYGSPILLKAVVLANDQLSAARRAESVIWPAIDWQMIWQRDRGNAACLRDIVTKHLRLCIRYSFEIADILSSEKI